MKKWSVVIVLAFAQFVMVLDGTVMNVSISTIVQELNTTVSALQSAITFYTLTMAAFMLIGAKLCARWGLLKAFMIGSVIYGIGSLVTGLSQNMTTLFVGWSIIEGLGAVLVIPAIAALVATNYKGKDRVTAFAIIGGISGFAAAAGPLIGGFMTTYLSWRYVFFAETIIILFVALSARGFKVAKADRSQTIDMPSALLSATGLGFVVYGLLQTKVWGFIVPLAKPNIAGVDIAPLGLSIVIYLLIAGIILLKIFYDRQVMLEADKHKSALVNVSILSSKQLRSGLSVLSSQYIITAAIFFIVPVYLQIVMGLNALETGLKILPLSIALILSSIVGSKLATKFSPKQIIRTGQFALVIGTLSLVASIDTELSGNALRIAMLATGAGLGLLASQLGNVNMSAVDVSKTSEVGGLQGTFQNLGSSLGTAVIGSVLIASLTSGFIARIGSSTLPEPIRTYIQDNTQTGVQIVSANDVEKFAIDSGVSEADAGVIADTYAEAQLEGLRESIAVIMAIAVISVLLSRHIPNKLVQ
jgi:MFS family permease